MSTGISWLDFKLGARMLVKYPGLTLVGSLGMAVAIAIGAGVFSVLSTIVDPTLPLDEGDRIVALQNLNAAAGDQDRRTHLHDLESWREELRAVADFSAYRMVDRNLVGPDGQAEPLRIAEMTASGFRVARVPPLLGRHLVEEDERPGAPPVVVIGHEVWQNRFDGDPEVIGATVKLGISTHTVVGVMPAGFAFPVNNRLWTPLRLDPSEYARGEAPPIDVFGRLAPGATLAQAQAQLTTLGQRMAAAHPETHQHIRPKVLPYARSFIDSPELMWTYYLAQLLVSMLLVVIAINVAILVYARTATRAGEIAVRLALGASRGRVVAQLFAEALVLSAVAAALGLLATGFVLQQVNAFLSRMGGEEVPFWWDFRLSSATLLYAAGLAVLAAVIMGVVPALKMTGRQLQANLRRLGGGTGMQMGRTWTVLIVAQVAVAVAILPLAVATGWNEFFRSGITGPGVAAEQLLSARIGMDRETPPSAEADAYRQEFASRFADRQAELVSRLEREPGVAAVTFASHVPGDWAWSSGAAGTIEVEDPRRAAEPARHHVSFVQADPGLFAVYDVPILMGRSFHSADLAGTATAVIGNRSFVQQVLGGGDALGRRFRYTRTEDGLEPGGVEMGGWYEIVGVVSDFPAKSTISGRGMVTLYHPVAPGRLDPVSLVVRLQGIAPESFAGRLREITMALDPTLRLSGVRGVAKLYRQRLRTERLMTWAIAMVTLSVLLLSAAGVHALMSFTVAQRRKEIGIRVALGAQPRRILGSILSRALRQLALGAAVGCLLAGALMFGEWGFAAERAAVLMLAIAAIVLSVGLLAALGPARRGLSIQPTEALRAE
ncbi:ABC transporter permease [soil metagenome]